jgi:maltose O-acetyltransferase
MLRHLLNFILYLLPPTKFFLFRSRLLNFAGIKLGKNVCFCGHGWIYGRGNLSIGDSTWLSPRVIFYTHLNANILIGSNCDIGPGVNFIIGSHEISTNNNRRAGKGKSNSIIIGNGCWIGANSTILDGVSIGNGVIIASGSIVTKSVPEGVLYAGVPAVFKRNL